MKLLTIWLLKLIDTKFNLTTWPMVSLILLISFLLILCSYLAVKLWIRKMKTLINSPIIYNSTAGNAKKKEQFFWQRKDKGVGTIKML